MKPERLILGTWGLSGDFGFVEDTEVLDLFEQAYQRGVRDFDTAYVYGRGKVEDLLGRFAQSKPDVVLATKLPALRKPKLSEQGGDIDDFYSVDSVGPMIDQSRDRMGRIDVLQLHNWHPDWVLQGSKIGSLLFDLQSASKIGRIGVSLPNNYSGLIPEGFQIVQLPLNLLERWAEGLVGSVSIEVWARSVFCHGALSGALDRQLEPNDKRTKKFTDHMQRQVLALKGQHGGSWELLRDAALQYVQQQVAVDKLIIGVRNREHLNYLLED